MTNKLLQIIQNLKTSIHVCYGWHRIQEILQVIYIRMIDPTLRHNYLKADGLFLIMQAPCLCLQGLLNVHEDLQKVSMTEDQEKDEIKLSIQGVVEKGEIWV